MGGLFGNSNSGGSRSSSTSPSTIGVNPGAGKPIIAGGFPDDRARPMPSISDPVASENLRNLRLKLSAASGRTATDLAGARAFVNNYLGSTG